MKITVYCHVPKETAHNAGKQVGLDKEALRVFMYAGYEHKLTYEVNPATGEATLTSVDDKELQ